MEDCTYTRNQVCSILGISMYTINNWYSWQSKLIQMGEIVEEYLPKPYKLTNVKGQPLMWSDAMIVELMAYQNSIVRGRNGKYGKYTNPRKH